MKKHVPFITFSLIISTILLSQVFGSGPPPPLRALPEGAKMRIGYGGNRQVATDFVFSPDGTRLAVVSPIIGIWIHDAHTGAELALLTGHTDSITSVMFSPDGKTIASGSLDKTVRLWDAHTFEHRTTLTGHLGNTSVLAFSPDSKKLATGASGRTHKQQRGYVRIARLSDDESQPKAITDGTIRIWDVATGKSLKTILTTPNGWISDFVFTQDNTSLACASTDGAYRIWNTETGKDEQFDTKNIYRALTFSPDGTRFVYRGEDKNILCDASTGKQLASFEKSQNRVSQSVIFSQNSETFITIDAKWSEIHVWNARTGQLNTTISIGDNRYYIPTALSPDGKTLAIQKDGDKGPILLLDTKTGNEVLHFIVNADVYALRFSPSGLLLAMMNSGDDDNRSNLGQVIRLWDIPSKTETGTIPYLSNFGHAYQPAFVASGKDGMLACGIGDARIWLFDGNTGKYIKTFVGHTDSVNNVAFSIDGNMLASASNDGAVKLWDPQTTQNLRTFKEQSDPGDRNLQVNKVVFAVDGLTLASLSGFAGSNKPGIQLWSVNTGKYEHILKEHPYGFSAIAFSPDGTTLASSGSKGDSTIDLWDTRTQKLKTTYIGHTSRVTALAFSPDGKFLASGGGERDSTVQLWNTKTGENSLLPAERPWGGVNALAFSPDGTLLAGAGGYQIEVWDIPFRQNIATLKGHSRHITSLAFVGDDNTLASASYDQTVVLWKPIPTVDENVIAKITPSSIASPAIGKHLTFNVQIAGGENVAGYHLTVQFDETALRYISSSNGEYLHKDAFFAKPIVKKNQVTLTSTALTGTGNGDGILATLTFEVVAAKPSPLNITHLIFSDKKGKRSRPIVKRGEVKIK